MKRRVLVALLAATSILTYMLAPSGAFAAPTQKKAIWGPVTVNGVSQFPTYSDLGAGIYQYGIGWGNVAPTRPANPTDPNDPAYQWPAELDFAIAEAARYGMRLSVTLVQSPPWANGGHADNLYAPVDPQDFADFATAASRRYPTVNLWQIWGEPSVDSHFRPFSRKQTPARYARLLDAAYGALKAVNPGNLVIGGNTITNGQIKPLDFIKGMKLPNGRPPRLDMYGHNPFSPRKPDLKADPKKAGTADISDLDTLLEWVDEYLRKGKRNRGLKLYVSEWTIPTDHSGYLFNFHGDRRTVATYLGKALRITNRMKRVYTFGWFQLYDERPNAAGNEMTWGLMTHDGHPKPAYFVFKRG